MLKDELFDPDDDEFNNFNNPNSFNTSSNQLAEIDYSKINQDLIENNLHDIINKYATDFIYKSYRSFLNNSSDYADFDDFSSNLISDHNTDYKILKNTIDKFIKFIDLSSAQLEKDVSHFNTKLDDLKIKLEKIEELLIKSKALKKDVITFNKYINKCHLAKNEWPNRLKILNDECNKLQLELESSKSKFNQLNVILSKNNLSIEDFQKKINERSDLEKDLSDLKIQNSSTLDNLNLKQLASKKFYTDLTDLVNRFNQKLNKILTDLRLSLPNGEFIIQNLDDLIIKDFKFDNIFSLKNLDEKLKILKNNPYLNLDFKEKLYKLGSKLTLEIEETEEIINTLKSQISELKDNISSKKNEKNTLEMEITNDKLSLESLKTKQTKENDNAKKKLNELTLQIEELKESANQNNIEFDINVLESKKKLFDNKSEDVARKLHEDVNHFVQFLINFKENIFNDLEKLNSSIEEASKIDISNF
ncbi:kinetochore-associated Ndc80 complex subunit NDC80 ASCRUDRAFT_79429 [Ascoidea rubescens DSM 1968]|uniref:Uncharacterized protein n=1 Tax=Ascoidea rubescens DSM 1968 TaxID=1344418 RepID=A0A1D2VMD3_9ASCO|nr:hypothetical protein ASCRUDRAFT_79429 [Ascoidea rubescens DSM 1968]ODV62771.1 hypothetical protein ASCRUDRAFT_79429 [Ascoidea rubescens DSM 1968]